MQLKNVGTSNKLFERTKSGDFAEIGKLKDGVNHHRVITGPVKVETIWYPTVVEKDGKLIQSVRTIIRPKEGTKLDPIAKLDEDLTRKAMMEQGKSEDEIKKYRSALRPQIGYRFLVFSRTDDNEGPPKVRPFDYPWSVKDAIEQLQKTESQKNKGFLEYGLAFMYDLYIEKMKDETKKSKKLQYSIDYGVKVVIETTPLYKSQGQLRIPTSWADWDPESGTDCPWNFEDYFTPEELEAIDKYDKDLEMLCKSNTLEEIDEKLHNNPLFLQAKFMFGDRRNEPMFPMLALPEVQEKLLEEYAGVLLLEAPTEVTQQEEAPAEQPKPSPSISLKDRLATKAAAAEEVQATEVAPTAPKPTLAPVKAPTVIKPAPTVSAPTAPVAGTPPPVRPPVKKILFK